MRGKRTIEGIMNQSIVKMMYVSTTALSLTTVVGEYNGAAKWFGSAHDFHCTLIFQFSFSVLYLF